MKDWITGLICVMLFSCSAPKKDMLVGDWQAVDLVEAGMPVEADIEVVQFHFDKNNQYQYHGTLNYEEAGTYYVESSYLFTTDTLNRATTEKAVEITQLTEDSLFIKMNDGGKERIMKLVKVK